MMAKPMKILKIDSTKIYPVIEYLVIGVIIWPIRPHSLENHKKKGPV